MHNNFDGDSVVLWILSFFLHLLGSQTPPIPPWRQLAIKTSLTIVGIQVIPTQKKDHVFFLHKCPAKVSVQRIKEDYKQEGKVLKVNNQDAPYITH